MDRRLGLAGRRAHHGQSNVRRHGLDGWPLRVGQEPGKDIYAHGGAAFARSLVRLGLVDEYRLLVHPVVLGRGLPIFSDLATPRDLQLADVQRFAAGAVAHVYKK